MALTHEGYDNNVCPTTGNVLRRFLDPGPFGGAEEQSWCSSPPEVMLLQRRFITRDIPVSEVNDFLDAIERLSNRIRQAHQRAALSDQPN